MNVQKSIKLPINVDVDSAYLEVVLNREIEVICDNIIKFGNNLLNVDKKGIKRIEIYQEDNKNIFDSALKSQPNDATIASELIFTFIGVLRNVGISDKHINTYINVELTALTDLVKASNLELNAIKELRKQENKVSMYKYFIFANILNNILSEKG